MSNWDDCEENVRNQIEEALETDPKRIGDVYNLWEKYDDDYNAIANELDLENVAGVYAYINYIFGIFSDFNTESPGKASQVSKQLNSFLKRHIDEFDESTITYIQKSIAYYDQISLQERKVIDEGEKSIRVLQDIEDKDRIYVYSFPHYVRYPHIESEDGYSDERYMLKIGRTTSSAFRRIRQQSTSMPEDPILYYVFTLGDSDLSLEDAETMIHDHLKTIGHRRSANAGGGREWFLTNFDSIVAIAELIGLELEYALLDHDRV